mgnify:CR=1 FL=1|tara:strand:- start:3798 stop:4637 length:840 start_codon:yes stop_codon:yes gene_type:complete
MINGLIVSKDRASQLRLLLESISLNAPNLLKEILIIHKSSNEKFAEGYDKLKAEKILPNIVWQEEVDFIPDFLNALKNCKEKYICGIVDDCIFYKHIASSAEDIERAIEDSNAFCFSFRLGLNTTTQNYLNPDVYVPLRMYSENETFIKWNWKDWDDRLNYGYPISLDGHIFAAEEISDLSHKFEFEKLRYWEGLVNGNCRDIVKKDFMVAYKQNVLFSIPSNCVQDPPLVSGTIHAYSEDELNEKYLNNEVIDFRGIQNAFQNVTWSHNEVKYKFKKI